MRICAYTFKACPRLAIFVNIRKRVLYPLTDSRPASVSESWIRSKRAGTSRFSYSESERSSSYDTEVHARYGPGSWKEKQSRRYYKYDDDDVERRNMRDVHRCDRIANFIFDTRATAVVVEKLAKSRSMILQTLHHNYSVRENPTAELGTDGGPAVRLSIHSLDLRSLLTATKITKTCPISRGQLKSSSDI